MGFFDDLDWAVRLGGSVPKESLASIPTTVFVTYCWNLRRPDFKFMRESGLRSLALKQTMTRMLSFIWETTLKSSCAGVGIQGLGSRVLGKVWAFSGMLRQKQLSPQKRGW